MNQTEETCEVCGQTYPSSFCYMVHERRLRRDDRIWYCCKRCWLECTAFTKTDDKTKEWLKKQYASICNGNAKEDIAKQPTAQEIIDDWYREMFLP